jgi:hypothetical protein
MTNDNNMYRNTTTGMLYLEFVVTEDKLGIAETVDLVEGGADITVDKNNLPAYLEAQLRYSANVLYCIVLL